MKDRGPSELSTETGLNSERLNVYSNSVEKKSELDVRLKLRDPRAIRIVEGIPEDRRGDVLEKYIILGDMLVTFSKIETSEKTLEDFLGPLSAKIQMLTDMDFMGTVSSKIDELREAFQNMYPTSAQKKGELTVKEVFESLERHFNYSDDIFENISESKDKFTDIAATVARTSTRVMIEVKEHSSSVPSHEVEKFWRDMELRDAKYGMFVSMRARIHNVPPPAHLETRLGRTAIFVVNSDLNWKGHLLAYYLIKKLVEIDGGKKSEVKGDEIHRAVSKVISHLKDVQQESDVIDRVVDVADGLKGKSAKDLQEIMDLASKHKKNLGERIDQMLKELSNADK